MNIPMHPSSPLALCMRCAGISHHQRSELNGAKNWLWRGAFRQGRWKHESLKWIHLSFDEMFLTQAYYEMAGIKGLHEQNGTNKWFYQEINKYCRWIGTEKRVALHFTGAYCFSCSSYYWKMLIWSCVCLFTYRFILWDYGDEEQIFNVTGYFKLQGADRPYLNICIHVTLIVWTNPFKSDLLYFHMWSWIGYISDLSLNHHTRIHVFVLPCGLIQCQQRLS